MNTLIFILLQMDSLTFHTPNVQINATNNGAINTIIGMVVTALIGLLIRKIEGGRIKRRARHEKQELETEIKKLRGE